MHEIDTFSKESYSTRPRFPRIKLHPVGLWGPRFFGCVRQADKVPKILGILVLCTLSIRMLGNLGPVHELCALFPQALRNLGSVQAVF